MDHYPNEWKAFELSLCEHPERAVSAQEFFLKAYEHGLLHTFERKGETKMTGDIVALAEYFAYYYDVTEETSLNMIEFYGDQFIKLGLQRYSAKMYLQKVLSNDENP